LLAPICIRQAADTRSASILSVIATSCGAAAGHLTSGLANIRLGLFLALFTVTGALAGASLVGIVPARALQVLSAWRSGTPPSRPFVSCTSRSRSRSRPIRSRTGSHSTACTTTRLSPRCRLPRRACESGRRGDVAAGLLSGLLGIGSGAFKVLAMDTFMRLPMKVSTATSNS